MSFAGFVKNQPGQSAGALSVAHVSSPEAEDGGHLPPILSVAESFAGDQMRCGPLLRVSLSACLPCREQTGENDAMRGWCIRPRLYRSLSCGSPGVRTGYHFRFLSVVFCRLIFVGRLCRLSFVGCLRRLVFLCRSLVECYHRSAFIVRRQGGVCHRLTML